MDIPDPTPPPRPTAGPSKIFIPWVPIIGFTPSAGESTETPTPSPEAAVATLTPQATEPPQPTQPPPPTSTPIVTRGPQKITKLGLGVYASGGGMLPILNQARPSIMLLMDPTVDFAQEVRRRFPRAFLVGRIYSADQPLDNPTQRGTDFADRVAQTAVPLKGVIDAWMSYNEVGNGSDPANLTAYGAFQVAFAHRLQDNYGIAAVAANDGPRALQPDEYPKYYGEAIKASKYFGLHIYPNADIKSLRDPNAADQVFFYRKIKSALDTAGIPSGPFIVTEIGLYNGWRGVVSDREMATDFTWVADQANNDPYVLGLIIFGVFRDNQRWGNFAVDGSSIVDIIGDYNSVH
jgi:hypothetical protein